MTNEDEQLLDGVEQTEPDIDTTIKEQRSGLHSEPAEIVEKPEQRDMEVRTQTTSFMNPDIYRQMMVMSKHFAASKALPVGFDNEFKVLVALQAGQEMGMKPFETLQSLYFVNGSLNIWGKATVLRLRRHGWKIEYTNESDKAVTSTVSKGKEQYTDTYTFDDAEKSGYTRDKYKSLKVGWREGLNRKLKLRYGVLSLIIKSYLPEVLGSANNIVEVQEDVEVTVSQENNLPRPEKVEVKPGEVSAAIAGKLGE